jgi:drug/metabolite transporter (DMT)-like permease
LSVSLPTPSTSDIRRGIFYMNGGVLIFALVNAAVKWLSESYPINEIALFRCVFALLPCWFLVATHGGLAALKTKRFGWHATRSLLQFISMLSVFTAFSMMPLADVVAIQFSSPLFLTALSVPLLGEKVGKYRWGAVAVGFIGVMLMIKPTGEMQQWGVMLALVNAGLGAFLNVGIRRLSATESSTVLVFYQISLTTLFAAALLPLGWVTPSLPDLLTMAAVGLGTGVAQFWWTQAFRFAPAAVNAPFSYMAMIYSLIVGYAVWGDIPGWSLLLGAGVVVLSGLFILHRETKRRAPVTSTAARQPAGP